MREVSGVYKNDTSLFGLVSTRELKRQVNSLLSLRAKPRSLRAKRSNLYNSPALLQDCFVAKLLAMTKTFRI